MVSRAARLSLALQKIIEGQREIEDIKNELENWRDGMSGTNLENTEKFSQLEDIVDVMTNACDGMESAISDLEDIEVPGAFGR